jgi:hypothetical protein
VLALSACGYHSMNAGTNDEHYAVVLASTNVPDIVASDEVVAGVREELAKAGALTGGESYPRCEVEILRADEAADAIGVAGSQLDARATRVGIVARAWIVRERGGARERDTGDVRAMDLAAVAPDAKAATFQNLDTMRAAGRRVGHSIGARLLGIPAPSS